MKYDMGRPRHNEARLKQKISVSIDADLLAWAKDHSGPGAEFSGVSHAMERGLALLKERRK